MKITFNQENHFWSVTKGATEIAKLFMDSFAQVYAVAFYAISNKDRETIRQLIAYHAVHFIKSRSKPGTTTHGKPLLAGNLKPKHHLGEHTSLQLMDLKKVEPMFANASAVDIEEVFKYFKIPCIDATAQNFTEIFSDVQKTFVPHAKLKFEISPSLSQFASEADDQVLVTVSSNKEFTFWDCLSKPSEEYKHTQLQIVPVDHPCMHDKKSPLMVNGDTDANIRSIAVDEIYSPPAARAKEKSFGTTWSSVNHPYKLTGNTFSFTASKTMILSKEGTDEVVTLLKSVLQLEDHYLHICGGFSPPFPSSHGMKDCVDSEAQKRVRGSEAHCFWTYITLKEAGLLEGSFIPEWFEKDGWLYAYQKYTGASTV